MTSESQIAEQIQRDAQTFMEKPYDGLFIPEGLIDKFKVAIMTIPPQAHNYNLKKLKEVAAKKEYDLNFLEVGMIVNLIFQIPFERLYITVEEGLDYTIQLEELRNEYNQKVNEENKKLEKKRTRLLELSGITKSIAMPAIKN